MLDHIRIFIVIELAELVVRVGGCIGAVKTIESVTRRATVGIFNLFDIAVGVVVVRNRIVPVSIIA